MMKLRIFLAVAVAATLGGASCAHLGNTSAAGDVIDPVDAAKTVVLHVDNLSNQTLELRTIVNGKSQFVGSVSPSDSTNILLDPTIFPSGFLYVTGIPADGRGRAIVGPLAASKGETIRFVIEPALDLSHATVIH